IPGDREAEAAFNDAKTQRDKAVAEYNQQMTAARDALALGQLDTARLLFRKAADIAPDGSDEQRNARQSADAIGVGTIPIVPVVGAEALVLYEGFMRTGKKAAREGRDEDAIAAFREALKLRPNDEVALRELQVVTDRLARKAGDFQKVMQQAARDL